MSFEAGQDVISFLRQSFSFSSSLFLAHFPLDLHLFLICLSFFFLFVIAAVWKRSQGSNFFSLCTETRKICGHLCLFIIFLQNLVPGPRFSAQSMLHLWGRHLWVIKGFAKRLGLVAEHAGRWCAIVPGMAYLGLCQLLGGGCSSTSEVIWTGSMATGGLKIITVQSISGYL